MILAMFLLGFYGARRGLFRDMETTYRWARRAAMWGLLLGLPVGGLYAVAYRAAEWLWRRLSYGRSRLR